MAPRFSFKPDLFIVALVAAVVLASTLPCRGRAAEVMGVVTDLSIALLFFLHGARLSRAAIIQGMGIWRLHLAVFACTFVFFPILGLTLRAAPATLIEPAIAAGVLYLCLLPSTVQSSIAMTAIAGGNIPAAVCSASASQFMGVLLTPLLVGLFMAGETSGGAGLRLEQVQAVAGQLLLPFVLGHLSRRWTADWIGRRKRLTTITDRGSIVLVVYTAFSAAVVDGLWRRVSAPDLLLIVLICAAILAAALCLTVFGARALGFSKDDEIALVFCGSQKGLAAGVPVAGVLFPAASVGAIILPVMLYHQMQLMAAAVLARRYAARRRPSEEV